jgi:hypothetical protein
MIRLPAAIVSSFFFLALPGALAAQTSRLKGAKFAQLGTGFRGAGPLVSGYAGNTFSSNVKGMVGAGFGLSRQADIRYKFLFVDGLAGITLYSFNRTVFINGQAGVSFNADIKNKFESRSYQKDFSLNYGALGGIEMEFYASRNLLFVLSGHQRYYVKRDFGHWRYQVGIALRFTL